MSKDTLLGFGGAVYINNEGEVRDSIFTNNVLTGTFAGYGGALSIKSGTVINCNFTNNKVNATVESNGGGLWIRSGTVRYCKFNNNYASKLGGALWTEDHSTISDCDFNNNKASDSGGAILYRYGGEVENCNFTNNSATDSGAIEMRTGNVINSNFNNNSASSVGGAISFASNGNVYKCNFTDNYASLGGGAIYFNNSGKISECDFISNKLTNNETSQGGAVFFKNNGEMTICNFINNTVNGSSDSEGSAVWIKSGNVTNCNFTGNSASENGGGIYLYENYDMKNCNFNNNSAGKNGGAVFLYNNGNMTYCNLSNNYASLSGGAVWGYRYPTVSYCNLSNNEAKGKDGYGGAISISSGAITNCNFANNTATAGGGAVWMDSGVIEACDFTSNQATATKSLGGAIDINSGTVSNCNFTENFAAFIGGAVNFNNEDNLTNCNVINNTAYNIGGGVRFNCTANVSNSNFTGNIAWTNGGGLWAESANVENSNFTLNRAINGSAIYFSAPSGSKTIKDSTFLANKADSKKVAISNDESIVRLSLIGGNNYINAIYSTGEVDFENVIYWGTNGITNTGTDFIPQSTKEVGQNITITIENYGVIHEFIGVTDKNGEVIINLTKAGEYNITAHHTSDSYYSGTGVSSAIITTGNASNMDLNISYDVVYASLDHGATGNVTFTISKDGEIVKTETVNLTESKASLDLSDLSVETYNISAKYNGDDNYRPSSKDIPYINYEITVTVSNPVNFGEGAIITFTMPEDIHGTIGIKVDEIQRPCIIINETTFQANVSDLSVGKHIASASLVNDPKYPNKRSENVSFIVTIAPSATFDIVKDENQLNVTLKDLNGTPIANATVEATINGQNQNFTTDENGVFTIEYNGNLTTELKYIDKNFVTLSYGTTIITETEEIPVTPVRTGTKIICENMVTTAVSPLDPKTEEYFTWKLVDENGNPIKNTPMQIGFNGVIYTFEKDGIQTDENSVAKLQINLGYAGDYTFAMCFLGDDDYNASFAVAKITVKKQTPQLVVASKTYAATAKTKALTATFKTDKGTVIADKWISFTVNGKVYKAKTNEKGVATVNVSLNKKGTYSFIAKFAGDSTYAAINKTAKLTIK